MNGVAYQPVRTHRDTYTHIIVDSSYPPNQPTLFYRESEMMWSAQMRRPQRPVSEQLASGSSLHTMGTSLHLLVEHLATQQDHPPVEHTARKREREENNFKIERKNAFTEVVFR